MAAGAIKHSVFLKRRGQFLRLLGVLCLLTVTVGPTFAQTGWYGSGWTSRQKITIDSDAAAYTLTGDLTDFPFLISITSASHIHTNVGNCRGRRRVAA